MVVLASAITTKNGKALLSRQFVELSKARIEGLLAAFPKLMGTEKQHTFIETENVRYIYQPLENLYILLITNKSSNILEDLETLHLLAKIVPEYCHLLEEKEIIKYSFDIIFAFDEAIAMGYKERVNIQQIKHFTSMESNDEIRFKEDQKNKMMQAKKEADRQRKVIQKKRSEERKLGIVSGNTSIGSETKTQFYQQEPVIESSKSSLTRNEINNTNYPVKKGLQLGNKFKKASAISQVLKEEDIVELPNNTSKVIETNAIHDKIQVLILEKISLIAENDGGLKNMEIKGELQLIIHDTSLSKIKLNLKQGDNKDFQFKSHPNMNKQLYSNDHILALKDSTKNYPLSTPSSVLKWRFTSKDENMIPLIINLWPSSSGSETTVPVEYEKRCAFDLHDIVIGIPIPGAAPVIENNQGSCEFDSKKNILFWKIPLIDESNSNGSMEFTVPVASNKSFFPVQVSFKSNKTFCSIQVDTVILEDGKKVDFSQEVSLEVEQYTIE